MITRRLLEYLPFALPLYLVRLQLGPLPTTVLELYLMILFVTFVYEYRFAGIRQGWHSLGKFRLPILAWLSTTLLAVFVAPHFIAGLGLWRAYILEPVLVFSILRSFFPVPILSRNLFLVVIGLTVWALIQFVTGYGIPHPWNVAILAGRRATGPFPYPNALALFVAPIGAYALSLIVGATFMSPLRGAERFAS